MIILKGWVYPNWGDAINEELVRLITGEKPAFIRGDAVVRVPNYLVVGSIIHFTDHESIVWGAGVLDTGTTFGFAKPKKVCAVRGPKTRDHLLKYDIVCPEVYGDPVLLLPRYYQPKVQKRYKLGIVTHWKDEEAMPYLKNVPNDVLYISSVTGFDHVYDYIDLINSCEKIASSSLHGVICADAYGIPAIRVWFREDSAEFKFEDYFRSVGRPLNEPLRLDRIDTKKILESFYKYNVSIDLDKLLDACPFKRRSYGKRKNEKTNVG